MKNLYLLLSPRFLGLRNSFAGSATPNRKRAIVMMVVGVVFWALMFYISSRVLTYFRSVEVIGDVLAHHLLSMILLTFFSLLIFSHIITALSNLYLSTDLERCHASPASLEEVFLSRSILTAIDSSWMVLVFGLPVLLAYGFVYSPGPGYYITLIQLGLPLIIIAAGIGILLTMVMVSIFPARRTRDIVMLLMIIILVVLYLMFRFMRPERLTDPDAFFSVMQYVSALKAPDSPYLPTHWVTESLWGHLSDAKGNGHLFEILLTWSSAIAMIVINIWVAGRIYFTGFSKSQEAKKRRGGGKILDLVMKFFRKTMGQEMASIMDKDMRTFFRDNTQWSQMLLLGALVVVYLYNFSALPLERSPMRLIFLQNQIAFLNMGLAGFVLAAVSVRFIFPAVSSEGRAFWIVQTSPLTMKRFLWGKFAFYLIPMLIMGEILIIFTNYLLQVTPFMMVLSSMTMLLVVFGIVALGIGFGAIYPSFNHENIAQVATGFGGMMYMIFCALFMAIVIVLEAGPVYIIFMANLKGVPITGLQWLMIIPSFLMVLLIIALAVFKPMKVGLKALAQSQ